VSSIPVKSIESNAFSHATLIERRATFRFPLALRVRFRTRMPASPYSGEGWVWNISRGGILVSSEHEIGVGTEVELNIEWPSLLYGRIPLRFVAVGEVVRCDVSSFAVVLARYQFRTAKKKATPIDAHGNERGSDH
jgi:PilZ domain